jgi:hypothetical protein
MRLSSEFWVKAYLRRCSAQGAFAIIARHGDDRSGAVFIKVNLLNGSARLWGPAPAGLEGGEQDRRFIVHVETAAEAEVDSYLTRQVKFDSDLWLVEVEDRQGRSFLDQ